MIAGIDAGGTTFKCVVASQKGEIIVQERVPTTTPAETIDNCITVFKRAEQATGRSIASIGIGSFGPIDVDPTSNEYGTILDTPKPGWSQTSVRAGFAEAFSVPVIVETDVNAALLAEMYSGAARGLASAAYVTIGTGIGAGIWSQEHMLGAPSHPEFGHIRLERHPEDVDAPGICSFHGGCLEGLASAAAFEWRFGDPRTLPTDHVGWRVEAFYLAQACLSLSLATRVERILLGGGLMLADHLLRAVQEAYLTLNNDYLPLPPDGVKDLIRRPHHGDDAGLQGALVLARRGLS